MKGKKIVSSVFMRTAEEWLVIWKQNLRIPALLCKNGFWVIFWSWKVLGKLITQVIFQLLLNREVNN